MTVGPIRTSNNSLPVEQSVPQKSWWSRGWTQATNIWPAQLARSIAYPSKCPQQTLTRIEDAAKASIEAAARANIRGRSTAYLQGEIQDALAQRPRVSQTATNAIEQMPQNINDPDITRVPTLRRRIETVDWKGQIKVNQARLTKKLTAFTILLRMRDRSGVEDVDNLKLMNIVKLHTEGASPKSLWTLFTTHYELSLFQTFVGLWVYWFYYMTSIVTNTIDAYLGSFIDDLTEEFTKEHSNARNVVIQKAIVNLNQFLVGDIQSSKAFSQSEDHGDLNDYQNKAIERHYGFSIEELCRTFSEKRVEDSPRVRFFKDFQEIPILGLFFLGFEKLVNRFIIRNLMRSWILPGVMETAVNKGLEATQPHNIPFSLSMTRFVTSQLEQLYLSLQEEQSEGGSKPKHLSGTEQLPTLIKNLKTVLALEPHNTSIELKNKLTELENANETSGYNPLHIINKNVDNQVAEGIEQGINDAGQALFHYINKTAKSGELWARMLELSCEPFSGETSNPRDLQAEYAEEQTKLERTAKVVFKELVRQSVAKIFKSQGSKPLAIDSFRKQKTVSSKIVKELNRVCSAMSRKIDAAAQGPSSENNVQLEIVEFLQIIEVFAKRTEFQEKTNGINGVHQNEIWRTFNPIFNQARRLQEKLTNLQTYQHYHPSHTAVEKNLREIQNRLQAIQEQFHSQPRHLQNPLMQSLNKCIEEVTVLLGANAPISNYLQNLSNNLANLIQETSAKQQTLDALEAIYKGPAQALRPRHVMELGIVDQIIAFEQGNPPANFRLSHCIQQLRANIAHLPSSPEREQIQQLIGNGRNLSPKVPELTRLIRGIYRAAYLRQRQEMIALNTSIGDAVRKIRHKAASYHELKNQDYASLKSEMSQITKDLKSMTTLVKNAEAHFSSSSGWPKLIGFGATALGAYVGPGVGAITGLISGIFTDAFSINDEKESDETGESTPSKIMHVLSPIGVTGFAASQWLSTAPIARFLPSWAGLATALGGYRTGWAGPTAVRSHTEEKVFNQVWDIYSSAYKLGLHPRIWKAVATRTMKTMADAD